MNRIILTAAASLVIAASSAQAQMLWETEGFDTPESVLPDPARDRLIVSNVVGQPDGLDGEGYLSLVGYDGSVIDPVWVSHMNAPKGMALLGSHVLVADMDTLRVIDAITGEVVEAHSPDGAVFLNDITVAGDVAFVTDMMTHTIWRYKGGEMSPWLTEPALSHPNGILSDGGRLIVASWGQGLAQDFTTERPGGLLSVSLTDQAISQIAPDLGNIDGIAGFGEVLVVSDWITGELHMVDPKTGAAETVATLSAGLADISALDGIVYLPNMMSGKVGALNLR
ncbi:hypothetical protein [Salipiger mucosus]|uniref:Periplasmic ATP/GTP-binding protein n=1 Tax=Salipiger mucosus DSM 16094 TaxID=1123237 RepID=S9QA10_9RHOB|nr:hypothetical protein [Salipiger mucosus]EPX76463.1 hypothetical protein Salmuc_00349 [Salipiger mucosus DSM 16094]